jgi:hypothetical protein
MASRCLVRPSAELRRRAGVLRSGSISMRCAPSRISSATAASTRCSRKWRGRSIPPPASRSVPQAPLRTQQRLLYGATRFHHPELTPDDCKGLVSAHNAEILWPMLSALGRAMGKGEEIDAARAMKGAGRGRRKPSPERTWDWGKLLDRWCAAGFDPASFGRQTPGTYSRALRARHKGLNEESIIRGFWAARIHLEAEERQGQASANISTSC